MRVGLTGSIASGKSEVARQFRMKGFPVFDADEAVHKIYADPLLSAPIAKAFPASVENGKVDRSLLSAHLVSNPGDFPRLEQIVHPLVRQQRQAFLATHEAAPFVMVDIPLLFETGEDSQMDCIVVVTTTEQLQRERALARPGMTEEKLARILSRQMPPVEKAARANFVIQNDGSIAELQQAVDQLIPQLIQRSRQYQ